MSKKEFRAIATISAKAAKACVPGQWVLVKRLIRPSMTVIQKPMLITAVLEKGKKRSFLALNRHPDGEWAIAQLTSEFITRVLPALTVPTTVLAAEDVDVEDEDTKYPDYGAGNDWDSEGDDEEDVDEEEESPEDQRDHILHSQKRLQDQLKDLATQVAAISAKVGQQLMAAADKTAH